MAAATSHEVDARQGEKMHPIVFKMPKEVIIMMKEKKVILRQFKKQ